MLLFKLLPDSAAAQSSELRAEPTSNGQSCRLQLCIHLLLHLRVGSLNNNSGMPQQSHKKSQRGLNKSSRSDPVPP